MANCSIGVAIGTSNCPSDDASCITCPESAAGIVGPIPGSINDENLGITIGIVTEENPITGEGVFDIYMRAGREQLDTQYELGRIKGADYTAAYIAMQEGMMAQANQFVIGKYQADVVLAKAESEIGIMKEKARYEIALLKIQVQVAATQEVESRRNGAVDRQLKGEQANETVAKKNLANTQQSELVANGLSKRALENGQNKVGSAQCELYAAQAAGFGDRNRNDTFKTIMNGWAVAVAENDNDTAPAAFSQAGLDNIIAGAVANSDGL